MAKKEKRTMVNGITGVRGVNRPLEVILRGREAYLCIHTRIERKVKTPSQEVWVQAEELIKALTADPDD